MNDAVHLEAGRFQVRVAQSDAEVDAALRLRYQVFVDELGAASGSLVLGREEDDYDPHCEHLILIDATAAEQSQVVGAYRLMSGQAAKRGIGFYSASEFDLGPILDRSDECLEVGRTCVAAEYRNGPAAQLLWAGLASYVFAQRVGLLFGCASFPGTDAAPLAQPLALLHHYHLAPPELRARARGPNRLPMDVLPMDQVDRTAAMQLMPSLIKGYLRLGGFVSDGAFRDQEFGVIDVFLVVDVTRVDDTQRKFYRDRIAAALARVAK